MRERRHYDHTTRTTDRHERHGVKVGTSVRMVDGSTGIVTSSHGGRVTVATVSGVRCYSAASFGRAA